MNCFTWSNFARRSRSSAPDLVSVGCLFCATHHTRRDAGLKFVNARSAGLTTAKQWNARLLAFDKLTESVHNPFDRTNTHDFHFHGRVRAKRTATNPFSLWICGGVAWLGVAWRAGSVAAAKYSVRAHHADSHAHALAHSLTRWGGGLIAQQRTYKHMYSHLHRRRVRWTRIIPAHWERQLTCIMRMHCAWASRARDFCAGMHAFMLASVVWPARPARARSAQNNQIRCIAWHMSWRIPNGVCSTVGRRWRPAEGADYRTSFWPMRTIIDAELLFCMST